jgi:putative polyhydroxyalkanoate system protein
MSDILIKRSHDLAPAQAKKAADEMAAKLREQFELESEWKGSVLHFHRSGVDGMLRLEAKAVEIEARLGFMLSMMKPAIENAINQNLDRIFGGPPKAAPKKPAAKKR